MTEGSFTYGTYPCHRPCSSRVPFRSDSLADRLPQLTPLPRISTGSRRFHDAYGTIRPSDCSHGVPPHFAFAYRFGYPVATREPCEPSGGHASIFRTVPSANTLVRRVDEIAFAFIVQARPCPVFGRPVRHRGRPHRLRPGASPHALRTPPHGGRPALSDLCRTQRGITPAFGYGAPHPSTRGTSTLLI